jgi:hypothetical protein
MHADRHDRPGTLTENSHVCQTDLNWARTSITLSDCSVFQLASAASDMVPSSA